MFTDTNAVKKADNVTLMKSINQQQTCGRQYETLTPLDPKMHMVTYASSMKKTHNSGGYPPLINQPILLSGFTCRGRGQDMGTRISQEDICAQLSLSSLFPMRPSNILHSVQKLLDNSFSFEGFDPRNYMK